MSMTAEKTVRELVLENPAATRVFEKLGIDYCCGGNKSLEEACRAANLSIDEVLDSLEMAEQAARALQTVRDWQIEPLADLVSHITEHPPQVHARGNRAPRSSVDKVCSVHGKNHPELQQVRASFQGIGAGIDHAHDERRDDACFPTSSGWKRRSFRKNRAAGALRQRAEPRLHDGARARFRGQALRAMREASSGYTAPPDGCISYQTLYQALSRV